MTLDSGVISLVGGSVAGMAVDLSLFPLDTVKTRLQSKAGFWAAGGFQGIYRGIGPAFVGSAPNAAIFFCTYDALKGPLGGRVGGPLGHMLAASAGEVTACLVRVPIEILKQRRQVDKLLRPRQILRKIIVQEGPIGLYRGYMSTIYREIPFSVIQFPLWEGLKVWVAPQGKSSCTPLESAGCGAVAGGVAAALTTPLDVAKTRIMLAQPGSLEARGQILPVIRLVFAERGLRGLFAGVLPRTLWISFGGSIFLGVYDFVSEMLGRR